MNHVIAYEGRVQVALGVMQEAYVPLYLPWVNRRAGIEGTLQRPPYSHAMGIEWIRGLDKQKGQHEVFAVLLRREESEYEYMGHMGIRAGSWPHGFATTGSILGAPGAQGRGIGTEAKLLLLYHAFMVMGLRKLTSNVKAWNAQSAGHLLKCGYQYAGRFKKHLFHNGEFVDEVYFEIFREDWAPIWQTYQDTATLPKLTPAQRAFISRGMTP